MASKYCCLYGYGLIDENNKIRNLSLKLTEATFYATSITVITKTVVGRSRPFYTQKSILNLIHLKQILIMITILFLQDIRH